MLANVVTERIRLGVQLPLRSAALSALSPSFNEHCNNKGITSLTLKSYELIWIEHCCTPSFPPGQLKRKLGVITISLICWKHWTTRDKTHSDTHCHPPLDFCIKMTHDHTLPERIYSIFYVEANSFFKTGRHPRPVGPFSRHHYLTNTHLESTYCQCSVFEVWENTSKALTEKEIWSNNQLV